MKFIKTLLLAVVLGSAFIATSEAMYLDAAGRPRHENGKMAKNAVYQAWLQRKGAPVEVAVIGGNIAAAVGTDNFMTTLKATIAVCGVTTVVGILALMGMDTSSVLADFTSVTSSLAIPAGAAFLAYLKRGAIGGWLQKRFVRSSE